MIHVPCNVLLGTPTVLRIFIYELVGMNLGLCVFGKWNWYLLRIKFRILEMEYAENIRQLGFKFKLLFSV